MQGQVGVVTKPRQSRSCLALLCSILPGPVLSSPVCRYPALPCLALSGSVLSGPARPYLALLCSILPGAALFSPTRPCLALPCSTLPGASRPGPVRHCPAHLYPILSGPVQPVGTCLTLFGTVWPYPLLSDPARSCKSSPSRSYLPLSGVALFHPARFYAALSGAALIYPAWRCPVRPCSALRGTVQSV